MMDAFDVCRVPVWREQPDAFFDRAVVDVDGTIVQILGECKQRTDFAYEGVFGCQTFVVAART